MSYHVSYHLESWPVATPLRITGRTWLEFDSVLVEVRDGDHVGRGEGLGVYYTGDTVRPILAQLEAIRGDLEGVVDRRALRELLPPGGARAAVDAALWDLEARRLGRSAWSLAGVEANAVETVFTIGLEADPEAMGEKAAQAPYPLLKIKLDGDRPVERVEAIRRRRPDARLVIDANQGWTIRQLEAIAEPLHRLGVLFVEQPLPRGEDAALETFRGPFPLCADESCLHMGELEEAARRYQMINIKLDKCGGLTEALTLARAARDKGMGLMVGSMGGTSIAMAPAHVLAQVCDFVDIDGPLILKNDRVDGFAYHGGRVTMPPRFCWGQP